MHEQGSQQASTLSEAQINRAIQDAQKYADVDRERKERVEKRTRAEALIIQAERQLREVALDFGMQFARSRRQRIDNICRKLRESLQANDDRGIDQTYADLQDALYELNREVRQYYAEDEDDDLLGTIRDLFTGDDEDDNIGGSPPIPIPRRPGPKPPNNDEAVLPPIDY